MIKVLIIVLGLLLLPGMASAQAAIWAAMTAASHSNHVPDQAHAPKPMSASQEAALQVRAALLITALSHGQERVVHVFAGPDGLVGAVVTNTASQQDIAWLTTHADVLLAGSLWGLHGEDLTHEAKIQQGLFLTPKKVLELVMNPARQGNFVVGTAGPTLTVFFDPNCIYCHQLYGELAPEISAGHVRVRFVIVGTLKASSAPRAASLLAAKNPAQALYLNENRYDQGNEEGGFPIAPTPPPPLTAAVQANSSLFGEAGFNGTPVTLYCDKAGVALETSGVPKDIKTLLAKAGACR